MRQNRILFVDDNVLCNLESCEELREHGYGVEEAYCASAALEVIGKRHHLSALVTDIDLGPGGCGFDVARSARAAYPGLPVIFISGVAGERVRAEGVSGAEFIAKPFHAWQIMEALNRALHLQAA